MEPRGAISRRVASSRDTFRSELWPLPALAIVVSIVLGVVLPRLDAQIDDNLSSTTRGYLFGGGADAVGHSAGLLCSAVNRDLGLWELRDEDERVRVTLCRPNLAYLLEIAVGGPRRYGAADPDVLTRIYGLLRELAFSTSAQSHRQTIRTQLERLSGTVDKQDLDDTERAELQHQHYLVEAALRGQWRPETV